jgi:hypothetical protein
MRIVIFGGSGQVGRVLDRALSGRGHEVVVVSRGAKGARAWDGRSIGPWTVLLEDADAVVNLAGRSVNCRYTRANLRAMMASRVESTRVVGEAMARAKRPPRVWLQMSTATIYAHTFGASHDEKTGVLGGDERGVPAYWKTSIDIAQAWEREQAKAATPSTRKVVLRSAMVMSPDRGGVFDVLLGLVRRGLGGPAAGGRQYVSWIHERDFARAVEMLLERDDLEGPFNLSSPGSLPQREMMATLRRAAGVSLGLPAMKWMLEIGAFFLRTDTELLLKSRRVAPGRLLDAGFAFEFPDWAAGAEDLVRRWRAGSGREASASSRLKRGSRSAMLSP